MPSHPDPSAAASVVIPVFNQSFYTRVCLSSLEREQGPAEVIVVDNGSTDDTAVVLATWKSEKLRRRVVTPGSNLGFAAGCNLGAEHAAGDFVVFLNNDTFLLEDFLPRLLRPFADPRVSVTGARLLYPNGRIQHAGIAFNQDGPHHVFVSMPGDLEAALVERDLQAVTGAAMAVRRSVFEELGGFDAAFHNSFEDIDLCLRVRQRGERVVYVPDAVAYHFESVSEGRVGPQDLRNHQLFMERWGGRFEQDIEALHAEARAAGQDPEKRPPTRRDLLDLEESYAEFQAAKATLQLRSVRLALAARNLFRRVVPGRSGNLNRS